MKKILILGQFQNTSNNFDGPGMRVCGVKKLFEESGFDVQLIGSSIKNRDDLSFKRSLSSFLLLDKRSRYIISYVVRNRFDLVHTLANFNGWFTGHIFIYFYKLWFGKLASIDIVDMNVSVQGTVLSSFFKRLDEYIVKDLCTKFIYDRVFVISTKLSHYYKLKKIETFLLPTITCNEMGRKDVWKNRQKTIDVNLLYVGYPFSVHSTNVAQFKDRIDLMVSAVLSSELLNMKLTIVGITAKEYLEKVPEHESLLASKKIEFLGSINRDGIHNSYKEADYFFLVRDKTAANDFGFPTKIVEALSNGLKIITTRTSDLDKYLTDTECIFVDYKVGEIEAKLNKLDKHYEKIETPIFFQASYYIKPLIRYLFK